MTAILSNYTPDQHYILARNKIIADVVGLTNFNEGSNTRAILEAVGIIASAIGFDHLEATRQAIPIALYTGLDFTKKAASVSTGFLRFYRLPIFIITYTGVDADVTLNIDATDLILTTSGTPADDLTVNFTTYPTIATVVAQIDAQSNWSASKIQNGDVSDLYLYAGKQIVANTNYRNLVNSIDVMYNAAPLINILLGNQASIDGIIFNTAAASTIVAGNATSVAIAAQSLQTGILSNIDALALDTLEGRGTIDTTIVGIEYVVNDSAFANGAPVETEEERAARFQIFVQGLNAGTTKGVESNVLAISAIKSVTIRERYPIPGVNTVIADDGTGNLSASQIIEVQKTIDGNPDDFANFPGKGTAGVNYNVEAPDIVEINVTATLTRIGSVSDESEIITTAKSVIERYINTRRLGNDVVWVEIIKRAKASHPSIFDMDLTVPAANVSISDSEVSRTGSGTSATVSLTVITLSVAP